MLIFSLLANEKVCSFKEHGKICLAMVTANADNGCKFGTSANFWFLLQNCIGFSQIKHHNWPEINFSPIQGWTITTEWANKLFIVTKTTQDKKMQWFVRNKNNVADNRKYWFQRHPLRRYSRSKDTIQEGASQVPNRRRGAVQGFAWNRNLPIHLIYIILQQ